MSNFDKMSALKGKYVNKDTPTLGSSGNGTSATKTNAPTKENNFERFFGDVSDNFKPLFEWKSAADGTTDPMQNVFDNALNGQYKAMLDRHHPAGGFVNDQFKKLGTKAWEIANYIKKGDENKASMTPDKQKIYLEKLSSLRSDFEQDWISAEASTKYNEKGMRRAEPIMHLTEDRKLQTKEDFSKANNLKVLGTGSPGNNTNWMTQAYKSLGIQNDQGAYNSVVLNQSMEREFLRKTINPIVSTWVTNGLNGWDRGKTNVEKLDNQIFTTGLIDHTISWISKYGSPSDKSLKEKASDMEKKMSKMTYEEKKNYIIENSATWKKMSDNLGFHGSQAAYKTYKDMFASPRYYSGETAEKQAKSFSDSTNLVSKRLRYHDEFTSATKLAKTTAYEQLRNDLGFESQSNGKVVAKTPEEDMQAMIYRHLPTSGGDPAAFEVVMKKVREAYGKTGSKFNRAYYTEPQGQDVFIPSSTIGSSESGGGKWVKSPIDNEGYSWNQMKEVYNDMVSKHKSAFGKLNADTLKGFSSITTGLDYRASNTLKLESINLDADTIKSSEANLILKMVKDQDFESGAAVKDIFITKKEYSQALTNKRVNELSSGENWSTKTQKLYFDKFFANTSKDEFDVEFSRESPLAGKAFYTFTKKGKKGPGSRISMYIDRNLANKYGDTFVKDTHTTPYDYSFGIDGEWDMKWAEGTGASQKAKGLKIINDNGVKTLTGQIWNPNANDGKGGFDIIHEPMGDNNLVSIEKAESITVEFLKSIKR